MSTEIASTRYPFHLVERWQLRDGTPTLIRPIRPSDLGIETAFAVGLSAQSSHRRLLSPRKLQPDELWRFTNVDYDRELALIAVSRIAGVEQQLAVARYVRDASNGEAEFAVVVADAWQRFGLATKLLGSLISAAKLAGVVQLSDITFSTNLPMLALARNLGFKMARMPGDATVKRLELML